MKQCREDKDKGNKGLEMRDVDIGKWSVKQGIKKDKDGIWNNGYGMYGMGSHGCNGMEMKTWYEETNG